MGMNLIVENKRGVQMGMLVGRIDGNQEKSPKTRFFNWIKRVKTKQVDNSPVFNSLKISKEEMALFDRVTHGNNYVPEHELGKLTKAHSKAVVNAGLVKHTEGEFIYDNMKNGEQLYEYSDSSPITEAIYATIDEPIYEDLDSLLENKADTLATVVSDIIKNASTAQERTEGLERLIQDSMKVLKNGKEKSVMALGLKGIFEKLVNEHDIQNETPEFMEQLMFLHLMVTQKSFYGGLLMPDEIKSANQTGKKMVSRALRSSELAKFFKVLAQQSIDFAMPPKEIVVHRFKHAISKLGISGQFASAF